jgi:hypothetical protein
MGKSHLALEVPVGLLGSNTGQQLLHLCYVPNKTVGTERVMSVTGKIRVFIWAKATWPC